jgi:uncharacterized membrane protein HdeD (DUF308 family)
MNDITSHRFGEPIPTRVSHHYGWLLGIRGLAAVLFGLAAILWPGLTLFVLVIFFGAYALVDGVTAVIVSFQGRRYFQQWWVLLVGGLCGVAIGVMTFLWPAITALVLLYLIASWAMVIGIFEIAAAFSGWLPGAYKWSLALAGILSVLFGLFLALRPGVGLLSLVWLIGIYAVVCGVLLLVHAFQSRAPAGHLLGEPLE